jgi:hypothetical protein
MRCFSSHFRIFRFQFPPIASFSGFPDKDLAFPIALSSGRKWVHSKVDEHLHRLSLSSREPRSLVYLDDSLIIRPQPKVSNHKPIHSLLGNMFFNTRCSFIVRKDRLERTGWIFHGAQCSFCGNSHRVGIRRASAGGTSIESREPTWTGRRGDFESLWY